MVMAKIRRPWKWDEVEKLLNMAQKYPTTQIAAEIGRPITSVRAKAHELAISLRMDRDQRQDLFTIASPPG
jgi:uncharacterized iron-regulated protein